MMMNKELFLKENNVKNQEEVQVEVFLFTIMI